MNDSTIQNRAANNIGSLSYTQTSHLIALNHIGGVLAIHRPTRFLVVNANLTGQHNAILLKYILFTFVIDLRLRSLDVVGLRGVGSGIEVTRCLVVVGFGSAACGLNSLECPYKERSDRGDTADHNNSPHFCPAIQLATINYRSDRNGNHTLPICQGVLVDL